MSGISKSSVDRIIDHLGTMLALQPRKRFRMGTVSWCPLGDDTDAEQSKI